MLLRVYYYQTCVWWYLCSGRFASLHCLLVFISKISTSSRYSYWLFIPPVIIIPNSDDDVEVVVVDVVVDVVVVDDVESESEHSLIGG